MLRPQRSGEGEHVGGCAYVYPFPPAYVLERPAFRILVYEV